jgi:NADH-quinone oxidoreductase subunit E
MTIKKDQVVDKEPLQKLLEAYGSVTTGDLIPLLQQIQQAYGYLPPKILAELHKQTRIPVNRIIGVATFYEQFHLEPHGRHTIKCCRGTACHVNGGPNIANAIQKTLNVAPGQTTEDMRFTFETVACLGTCFLAPVMMVDKDYFGHLNADKVGKILQAYA